MKWIFVSAVFLVCLAFSFENTFAVWYSCPATNPSISTPASVANKSTTYKTVCPGDGDNGLGGGDALSQVATPKASGAPTSGILYSCLCHDSIPPDVTLTQSVAPTVWTNQPVTFSATVTKQTTDGSPYSSASYSCPGTSGTSTSANFPFTCSGTGTSAQTATVTTCDTAGNCTPKSTTFLKENTAPTVAPFTITGHIKQYTGFTPIADTTSPTYTYTPAVTLNLNITDAGGSGLRGVFTSCSSTTPTAASDWKPYTASFPFNLTSSDGCNLDDGLKTVHVWAIDHAGNITPTSVSSSITYDTKPPTFSISNDTLLVQATNSYSYTPEVQWDTGAGVRDFSLQWIEPGIPTVSVNNIAAGSPGNFWAVAQFVSDDKRTAEIKIVLTDRAGNMSDPKMQKVEVIAEGIIAANNTIRTLTPTRSSTSEMTADMTDYYEYRMVIKDQYGNIIRPVDNLRSIQLDWGVKNDAYFINGWTGAVLYSWDEEEENHSDTLGNTYTTTYTGSTRKKEGQYNLKIFSSVPTKQGYSDPAPYVTEYTSNEIQISKLAFKNTILCPSGYRCWGVNTGRASPPSDVLGDIASATSGLNSLPLAPGSLTGLITQKLAFRPILDVILKKDFSTLTDNSWHTISVDFVNNSTVKNFQLDTYRLELRYTKDLFKFADAEIKSTDLGNYSSTSADPQTIWFTITPPQVFNIAPTNGNPPITKTFQLRTNTYGVGFGQFGFIAYLPYAPPKNTINQWTLSYPTGYNTRSLSIYGVQAYSASPTIPIANTQFTDGLSSGQEITVQGLFGDRKAGNTSSTLKSAIQVDVSSINVTEFKATIQRNTAEIIRWLTPDNTTCNVTLPTNLTKDTYYYDFSNISPNPAPGINGNRGCNLTIAGSPTSFGSSSFNTQGITGKKTIIVRGGNVKINADLFYGDSNSMLALVVLRNDTDKKLGGDIFVKPEVTNIVGWVYADGSIMSYDGGTKIYDSDNTSEGDLTRQLLWYGSIFSSNSIGGAFNPPSAGYECPYNSDTYLATGVKTCSQTEASKYDLAFLRRFVTIHGTGGKCISSTEFAAKDTGMKTLDYAFAGKRKCYADNMANNGLKGTEKTTSTVIEYNPAIQSSGMRIFSAQ